MGSGLGRERPAHSSAPHSISSVAIPCESFARNFDVLFDRDLEPLKPTFCQTLPLVTIGLRLVKWCFLERMANRVPFLDPFHDWSHSIEGGVPCGGLGCGSIGRGWRGFFNRWGVGTEKPSGIVVRDYVKADAFHVFCRPKGSTSRGQAGAVCLLPELPSVAPRTQKNVLRSWRLLSPHAKASYYGLFPRSWTVYEEPVPGFSGVFLTCCQTSPIMPHNYDTCSFPVCVFEWVIENRGNVDLDISLMFTFQNGVSQKAARRGEHRNKAVQNEEILGVQLDNQHQCLGVAEQPEGGDPLSFLIGAMRTEGARLSYETRFPITKTGSELWDAFSSTGQLSNSDNKHPSRKGEAIGAAVCASVSVNAGSKSVLRFVLSWDSPVARFGHGVQYMRRYTQFLNPGKFPSACVELATRAAFEHKEWTKAIENWQNPILQDKKLPEWYKTALFNELYYLVEGGTVWTVARNPKLRKPTMGLASSYNREATTDSSNNNNFASTAGISIELASSVGSTKPLTIKESLQPKKDDKKSHQTTPSKSSFEPDHVIMTENEMDDLDKMDVGQFAYLESLEYVMYNTYDVHFYASFALSTLWPLLQISLQTDVGISVPKAAVLPPHAPAHILAARAPVSRLPQMIQKITVPSSQILHTMSANLRASTSHGHLQMHPIGQQEATGGAHSTSCTDDAAVGQPISPTSGQALDEAQSSSYKPPRLSGSKTSAEKPSDVVEGEVLHEGSAGRLGSLSKVAVSEPEDEFLVQTRFCSNGRCGFRKVWDVVPHDLGSPCEDPWHLPNAYSLRDTCRWKDLPCKFILSVYHDYVHASKGNLAFLKQQWPMVYNTVRFCEQYYVNEFGMIENEGKPDQTYDVWTSRGISAYCGVLWLAALSAAAAMAQAMGQEYVMSHLKTVQNRAAERFEAVLWNGRYYNYDSSGRGYHDSIMADQMAGQFYARVSGLPAVCPHDHIVRALRTVYEFNVKRFGNLALAEDRKRGIEDSIPLRGAVNGMRPDGKVDMSSLQSQEVWSGTTYMLAACMLLEGLVDEAWDTARGCYEATYVRFGFWYSTPEAWLANGKFRALCYMRPLSVWSIQHALDLIAKNPEEHAERVAAAKRIVSST